MWMTDAVKPLDMSIFEQANARQQQLTKPPGSLGRLEAMAVRMAARQAVIKPSLEHIHITVFAGDHGVAEEGVSAFPQAVTAEMVKNFARGGAAISVLAKEMRAHFEVVDAGVAADLPELPNVISAKVAKGTQNFAQTSAMNAEQCANALNVGRKIAWNADQHCAELFIAGEMGIANTTSATVIAAALLQMDASDLAGAGTGLDAQGISHKARVIEKAMMRLGCGEPLDVLMKYGGFEIAAMVGAYIACSQKGITILVDGFISSVAALVAVRMKPEVRAWMEFSHQSAEQGHRLVLQALEATPILDLGMRLGEGSGAAVAVPILKSAVALHNQMATFEEASVSQA